MYVESSKKKAGPWQQLLLAVQALLGPFPAHLHCVQSLATAGFIVSMETQLQRNEGSTWIWCRYGGAGAVWQIFARTDVPLLQEWMQEHATDFLHEGQHPSDFDLLEPICHQVSPPPPPPPPQGPYLRNGIADDIAHAQAKESILMCRATRGLCSLRDSQRKSFFAWACAM